MKQKPLSVILVNSETLFARPFTKACTLFGIKRTKLRSKKCVLLLEDANIRLLYKGKELAYQQAFFFIRKKGKNENFIQIMCEMFKLSDTPFTDESNLSFSPSDMKAFQMLIFSHHHIPIPKTMIVAHPNAYHANRDVIMEHFSFPLVLKTRGERGDAVWKISTESELIEKISNFKDVFLIQTFAPNDSDIRALVFNDHILGAIKRSSSDGFYNNISKGGVAEPTELTEEEQTLCIKVCALSKIDFGGVDFIRTKKGPLFIEVNKSPQIQGFSQATDINVPEKIVEHIHKMLNE
jgi:RimK family alpha-L-glutamate ligase